MQVYNAVTSLQLYAYSPTQTFTRARGIMAVLNYMSTDLNRWDFGGMQLQIPKSVGWIPLLQSLIPYPRPTTLVFFRLLQYRNEILKVHSR